MLQQLCFFSFMSSWWRVILCGIRHLLCIKIACVTMEFWCIVSDEYCTCRVYAMCATSLSSYRPFIDPSFRSFIIGSCHKFNSRGGLPIKVCHVTQSHPLPARTRKRRQQRTQVFKKNRPDLSRKLYGLNTLRCVKRRSTMTSSTKLLEQNDPCQIENNTHACVDVCQQEF